MNTDPTNQKAVENLTAGDHLSDSAGVHELVHVLRYQDGDGREMFALTQRPLGPGDPWVARHRKGITVRLATEAEISEYTARRRREALAQALHRLADDIIDQGLPVPTYRLEVRGCLNSRADVERWAKHLDGDLRMGGTDKDIPVAAVERPVLDGLRLELHFQGPSEPTDDELAEAIDRAFAPVTADQQAGA